MIRGRKITLLIGFVLLTMFVFSSGVVSQEVFNLKVGCQMPVTEHDSQTLKYYFDNIAEESGGRIKVQYFFSASLVKVGEDLHAVHHGILDSSLISAGYTPKELPLSLGLDMAYTITEPKAKSKAIMKLYKESQVFRDEWEKNNNVKILFCNPHETLGVFSKNPVPDLESLKMLKVRTYGLVADAFSRLGAVTVSLPISGSYEAVSSGLVDAVSGMGLASGYKYKIYEVTDFLIDTGYGAYCVPTIVMNLDTWNKLPADIQAIFNKWSEEIIDWTALSRTTEEHEVVKKMVDEGMQIQIWSKADKKKAAEIVQPAQMEEWVKNNYKKTGLSIEEYKEFMEKYLSYLNEFESPDWSSGYDYYIETIK